MRGAFFEPKPLDALSLGELAAYKNYCVRTYAEIEKNLLALRGEMKGISRGFAADGWVVAGGLVIVAAGIFSVTVLSGGAALTLAGGALTFLGGYRHTDRFIERSLISDQIQSRDASLEFLNTELARIEEELTRRKLAKRSQDDGG